MTVRIRGAREHNLQGIDVEFGEGLTVVTGVSGSGKTSLVFDTLYHEARRRFLEVFSLGSLKQRLYPAQVEAITGIGPAIAVGQNILNRNPNSSLASASGLHPFFRLLYTRFGERFCANCGHQLAILSEDEIVNRLRGSTKEGPTRVSIPLLRSALGSHRTLLKLLQEQFPAEAIIVDGQPLSERHSGATKKEVLDPSLPHDLDMKIAQWSKPVRANQARRIVQLAGALGSQTIVLERKEGKQTLSKAPVCPSCGSWFDGLAPAHFHTACPTCAGDGCDACQQTGLDPLAANVRWQNLRLTELLAMPVEDAYVLFRECEVPATAERLHFEIDRRLAALRSVGLGYITLDRPSPSLSRGESQRVRLAIALTSRLEDMLHVLDEPTIGQHPVDVARLLPAFRSLAGPVIFVEHDRLAATAADHALDLGPGAGREGGRLLFSGTPSALWKADTPTGRYFSLRKRAATPKVRSEPEDFITIREASLRNLQNIDVAIPLSRLSVITGISGSGKSTLVEDVLVASLLEKKPIGCRRIEGPELKPVLVDQGPIGRNPRSNPATYTKLAGLIRDFYAKQTGLSATHFSFNTPEGACPACNGMGAIEVRMRYLPSTWIRCGSCLGERFADEVLDAKILLGEQWLSIADFYRLSIAEAHHLLFNQGQLATRASKNTQSILQALLDVGLGYLPIGQPSPTLSGGEAQRVKLAKFLGQTSLSKRLLVLDEPSTGLHPYDITGLLVVLDRLVRSGATVVVVEHNTDIIRAADWLIDLGPGAGPEGGQVVFVGPVSGLAAQTESLTGKALKDEMSIRPSPRPKDKEKKRPTQISMRGACLHNLKDIDVDIPKGALTVVTGVSGSGKSSLVSDVLETEARRRFLESLSLYERQSTKEGAAVEVESVSGLGVTISIGPERRLYDYRATVGTATGIVHHLAVLYAWKARRRCLHCGAWMQRSIDTKGREIWTCPSCSISAPLAQPRHFIPSNYAAACQHCQGVGTLQTPNPDKLIIHPEKPLCDGAMYSPGFFPKGYLCKPYNHGYDMVQALAARYGFDPAITPWDQLSPEAQKAFLFGDPIPMQVTFQSRSRTSSKEVTFPGFYGWLRDWDVGGTYTDTEICPQCQGARLRQEYLSFTLGGNTIYDMTQMPLNMLAQVLGNLESELTANSETIPFVHTGFKKIMHRLGFLLEVGLGYLHLNRSTSTLSAGEAQRIKLSGLLGGGLTSLTILLDEPSRGLHPAEVKALLSALQNLRAQGNTVIVVEHDPVLIRGADHLIDLGPGAGVKGGQVVAQGTPKLVSETNTLTAKWMRGDRSIDSRRPRRQPKEWLTIRNPHQNNLKGEDVQIPLKVLTGVCGVSGAGKSTLMIDTLGRALAPKKHTTSVAHEPLEPGAHEIIENAPKRTIIVDQSRAGVVSPASYLRLEKPLRRLFAMSEDAQALGVTEQALSRSCSACKGRGASRLDMGFLPDVYSPCDTCQGTGLLAEAWEIRLRDVTLPDLYKLTIDEVYDHLGDFNSLSRPLEAAREVGLGYLLLRQHGYSLSGGEAQRLKIAREFSKKDDTSKLYLLDEPTVGQHMEDVARLLDVLHKLVQEDHSVIVIEHHPHILASCDWLIELGPGGGPEGGRVVAVGTPETLSSGDTPIAPYLHTVMVVER